jgi:hypothetical protein
MVEGLMTRTDAGNLMVPQRGRGIRQFDFKWSLAWDILTEAQLTGVTYLNTTNRMNSADTIRHLYHWSSQSNPVLLNRMRKGGMEYGTKENIRVQFLTGLPQIGPEVARQLIEAFRTPWAALAMFQGDGGSPYLKNIKGLGAGKIAAVRKVMFE